MPSSSPADAGLDVPQAPSVAPSAAPTRRESPAWAVGGLVLDLLVLVACAWLALRATTPGRLDGATLGPFGVLGTATLVELVRRSVAGPRQGRMDRLDATRQIVTAVATGLVLALATAALAGTGAAGTGAVALFAAVAAGALACEHLAVTVIRERARVRRGTGVPTLILGAGAVGGVLERRMLERPSLGLRPVGFLDDDPPSASTDVQRSTPIFGSSADLEAVVERTGAQHVIVAFSARPDSEVLPIVSRCQRLGLEVSLVPRLFEAVNHRQRFEQLGPLPVMRLTATDPSSAPFVVKHLLSRAIAAVVLVAASPLLVLIAVAVKVTSPGPVLFRQERVGRDGRVFRMIKFRSMRAGLDAATAGELEDRLSAGRGPGGVEGADRRTRLGTFLRRSALDELPQLLNVLAGDMDLVGPRPERPELVALLEPTVRRYDERHRVKAGMTGWAQINGLRGDTSLEERIEWDNWYINNWSIWLDLKILIWTPLAVLKTSVE